jgi:hypothetical protein
MDISICSLAIPMLQLALYQRLDVTLNKMRMLHIRTMYGN